MGSTIDEAKGRLKQAAGDLTDDKSLKAEGTVDRASATVKDAAEKVKDGVEDAVDSVKDRIDDHR